MYISSCASYNVTNYIFDRPVSGFYGGQGISYGLVVDGNAALGYGIISNNSFYDIHIGVQAQNEKEATFLKCNTFSAGNAQTATLSYDVCIASGTLRQHNGCGISSSPYYSMVPGNTFSQNPISADRNIFVSISNTSYSALKQFQYYYGNSKLIEKPTYCTIPKVNVQSCNKPSLCSQILAAPASFSDNFVHYSDAKSRYDSLVQLNSTDTGDLIMNYFYKNHFLDGMVQSISDTFQYDSLIEILSNDTSLTAQYFLLQFKISKGEYIQAQQIVDNLNPSQSESNSIKKLYSILIPIYNGYCFDSINVKRAALDSLTQDSSFGAKQAQYIINYIDKTNAELNGMENFIPLYNDTILPVEGIDTNTVESNDYIINVYPNPFETIINADFKNTSLDDGNFTMTLYDSYGIAIGNITEEIKASENKILKLETEQLSVGVYYLQFTDKENQVIQSRIVFKLP